jgi:16S rRNA (cytosine1402-N4)-methyltransferase
MGMEYSHKPVLLDECIEYLGIKPNGNYIDATLGGGGHSEAILSRLKTGRLLGIDRDSDALCAASERLSRFGELFAPVKANFSEIAVCAKEVGIDRADGILFDLGVSSYQLDNPERGFSYMAAAPLDMRMDNQSGQTAADVVNGYPQSELERILFEYGEEKFARSIAAAIVRARSIRPIETTAELSEIIISAILKAAARAEKQHPAKRSFQAIRIEVNGELEAVKKALPEAVSLLSPGGRLCVITFHSLEDRIVKHIFGDLSQGCVCPREFPVCICGRKPVLKLLTKKPVAAGEKEQNENPRARSAKLRAAEKII